jgi:hypothetical protein
MMLLLIGIYHQLDVGNFFLLTKVKRGSRHCSHVLLERSVKSEKDCAHCFWLENSPIFRVFRVNLISTQALPRCIESLPGKIGTKSLRDAWPPAGLREGYCFHVNQQINIEEQLF